MKKLFTAKANFERGEYRIVFTPVHKKREKKVYIFFHGVPAWTTKNYDIAELIARSGYEAIVIHYRGLGFSEGKFSFSQSIANSREWIVHLKKKYSKCKICAVGHSWGGFVALNLHDLFDELILLAPLIKIPEGKALTALVNGLLVEAPSDLVAYSKKTLAQEFSDLKNEFDLNEVAKNLKSKKILLVHGKKDEVLPFSVSDAFIKSIPSRKKKMVVIDDGHLLIGERRKVYKNILDWVL